MLQLSHIKKAYQVGDFTQVALNDVSVSFRDNEFVAILGPSGSGKTTLLNIIGGLDHYDSGNLTIDGVSTEDYKDRDWDTYRNNRIGFVFQSYNLIPHQTILANVELALTLSGVSKEERRERALEALDRVGLSDHVNKKPSQLSGGQMQRVAIARALINNPEILLADEPTGALDSKTSVQIMDLLTEIANDRLVIMVTHNPELADQYANRIVNLSDGVITSDSNPYNPTEDEMRLSEKVVRRTSMSFLTALSLSFNNLMTKKGRTLMTAFAGSIGIIGIAAILALANGVNDYIKNTEEETLSEYPLQIMSTGFDITSLVTGMAGSDAGVEETETTETTETVTEEVSSEGQADDQAEGAENSESSETTETTTTVKEVEDGNIRIAEMVTNMFGSVGSNDLGALKVFLESVGSGISPYVNAIEYSYNVAPQIFSSDVDHLRQVNPDRSFAALGIGSTNTSNSLMSMTMSTDVFSEMPNDPELYVNSYDVKAGRWPENYNEVVLVTTPSGYMSDFMLYTLGLREGSELDEMVAQFAADEEVTVPDSQHSVNYSDIVGITFKLVNAADYYTYDSAHNVWIDKYNDNAYLRDLVAAGEDITVVGIVQPKQDATATMLTAGLNYPASLIDHIIEVAGQHQVVQDQLANPGINVFTGRPFGEEEPTNEFNMNSLFTINTKALRSAFTIDTSRISMDLNNVLDLNGIVQNLPEPPSINLNAIARQIDVDTDELASQVAAVVSQTMQMYQEYSAEQTANGETPSVSGFLQQQDVRDYIQQEATRISDDLNLGPQIASALENYIEKTLGSYLSLMLQSIQDQVSEALRSTLSRITAAMGSAVSIDASAFARAFQFNMSEQDMMELMTAMMTTEPATYEGNLEDLGYAELADPSGIDIYPIDFESKEKVIEILDNYNDRMAEEGNDDKVITYTDFVGTLMSSVTQIVSMISTMLVAFVSISLIVSSIMIGVITYISVLERKKEIGILRAIGASKGNISSVFNAETVIIGFTAGLIGVTITYLGSIPANALVYNYFQVPNIVQLPITSALILIGISVFLTFLAGLIPASSASRKDPVEALRSE